MRIAFFCKRHYSGKDVIRDRYGRLYEWPYQLTKLGHEVKAWSLDYYGTVDQQQAHHAGEKSFEWISYAVGKYKKVRFFKLPKHLQQGLIDFQPDLIIGASDIPHVALARWIAKKISKPFAIDLYDNFESFGQANIPGFKALLANAIIEARLVITVSNTLKDKLLLEHIPRGAISVMPNGINKSIFTCGCKSKARDKLGLPDNTVLIGTAGGLSKMKGLDVVFAAWPEIQIMNPAIHLVLAGPIEKGLMLPKGSNVHYLGQLKERDVATLFQALDVGIVPMKDSSFGRYCFPQKLYEMLACQLPVVVSDVGEMKSLLSSWPQIVFSPENIKSLVSALERQITKPSVPNILPPDWSHLFKNIDPCLREVIEKHKNSTLKI